MGESSTPCAQRAEGASNQTEPTADILCRLEGTGRTDPTAYKLPPLFGPRGLHNGDLPSWARNLTRPSGEEERTHSSRTPFVVSNTSLHSLSHICSAARPGYENTINELETWDRDTSSPAFRNPSAFHRDGPLIALLDMSSVTALRLPQVNTRMRLIDVCHLYSKNEHPCLGDSLWFPTRLPSPPTREPAGSRRHARRDVLQVSIAFRALSSLPAWPRTSVTGTLVASPRVPSVLSHEWITKQGRRPCSPHPRERCMDRPAQGAFR